MTTKNLFVPLRGMFFDAFARGEKCDEWRRLSPRWSVHTCSIGRGVTLSRGYSGARLTARILRVRTETSEAGDAGVLALYGRGILCLVITLHQIAPLIIEQHGGVGAT